MTRPCGCTYRDVGLPIDILPWWWMGAISYALDEEPDGLTWGELCNKLRANTDQKRDGLHRLLHEMATPEITPEDGPGRRGTRWHSSTPNG